MSRQDERKVASKREPSSLALFESARYYRLAEVIGNPRAEPPIVGKCPMSETTWFKGVREGRFPKGTHLSANVVRYHGAKLNAALMMLESDGASPVLSKGRPRRRRAFQPSARS